MENRGQAGRIRLADASDLPIIAQMEAVSFTLAWTESMLRDSLAHNRFLRAYILEEDGLEQAYLLAQHLPPEAELLRLGVLPRARRRGLGRRLLNFWLEDAGKEGCEKAFLEVREHNLPAKLLYRSQGFVLLGRRPRYYDDSGEDAEIMGLLLKERQGQLDNLSSSSLY